jgi:hypothetical protein
MLARAPERFGALQTVDRPRALGLLVTQDETPARENADSAALRWQAWAHVERRAAELGREAGAIGTGPGALEEALTRLRRAMGQAQDCLERCARALDGTPSLNLLGHSVGRVVARLEPRELTLLRTLLTAPQAALAFRLREMVKDVVLGREDRER